MKKLLSEEKTDLRPAHISSKILFFILLFSSTSFNQIPINGFCKLDKISAPEGYNKIFSFNYNKDSYTDLLLFNPLKTEVSLLTGEQNLKFSKPKTIKFPFEPAQFKPVYDSLFQISYYAFTSRRSRLFGTLTFNENGNPTIIQSVKLNSYPEVIDEIDPDNNGKPIFLVCGKSFDGISIFNASNEKLEEEKIISGTSFSFAQFIHLNSDDIIDIIAYNLFEKSLFFLINNGRNEFNISRKIQLDNQINYLHIFDINLDSFKDIIYSDENGIKILFGDPLYLFEKSTSTSTNYKVDNIAIADFNHDGLFDILYSSNENGIVSALFTKNQFSFYEELIYLQTSTLSDLIPFFTKFIYGAVYLNESGEIGILSEVNSLKDDITISLAILPEDIIDFDYNNNGINDFAFIDKKDRQLKFILRNNVGIPAYYYSIKLFSDNNKLLSFDQENSKKIFYIYSQNQKLIEILYVDFSKFKFSRENLYVDGDLLDLMITSSTELKPNIHVLTEKNNKLEYKVYTYSSIKYISVNYPEISENWFDALILNPYKNQIAYWAQTQNQYQLIFNEFLTNSNKKEIIYSISTENKIKTYSTKALLSEDLFLFSSVIEDHTRIRLLMFDQNIAVFSRKISENIKMKNPLYRITNSDHLSFGNDNLLYFYNEALKNFNRVFVNRYYNRFNIVRIFEDINIKNFLVTKLDTRNKHLVYIDSVDNLIKVKKIT
ncbi:MAG: VCBS repeat-containing protein [Ignavibacterium sp.]|uniref:FG-GAP repeat domain-containing protein n=1 Tax=Ignavibacterium sp. TaxID=2651167 RepID=UPI00329715AB